jgi:hypothetical protein
MSSITASSTSLESILNAALESYTKQTVIDLTGHPSAEKVQNCHSPEDILELLLERETAFKDYRNKYRKLINCLRPVVQVIHAISGVFGEATAAVLVSSALDSPHPFMPLNVPCRCSPQKRYSSVLMFSSWFVSPLLYVAGRSGVSWDIHPHQAAIGVTESYDALLDLFECVANFLRRLHIYTEKIPLSPSMSDIMVKIMSEVLSVFALATAQIKQGRISK